MNEDDITNALIRWHEASEKQAKEWGETDADVELFPEAHYNHFGNRGVVDLYTLTGGWYAHVYEIKSESAVRNSTGANEIIRQFNRAREFFFEGSKYPRPTSSLTFELCFTPTEYNANHVVNNADLYSAVVKSDIASLSGTEIKNVISFRLPEADNIEPLLMFSENFDFRERIRLGEFDDYGKAHSRIYHRIRSAFEDL